MRLRAWDLTIESAAGGGSSGGLSFEASAGLGLIVTGPNGAGKTSLLRALAGFLPIEAGGFALDGGDNERTVGEQAHYLGHADGVKVALTAGENLAFAAAMLGGDSSRKRAARGSGRSRLKPCDRFSSRGCSPPARGDAWRSPACLSPSACSGCSTSRRPRSTPRRARRACRHHAGASGRRCDPIAAAGPRAARIAGRTRAEARGCKGSGGVRGSMRPPRSPCSCAGAAHRPKSPAAPHRSASCSSPHPGRGHAVCARART